MLIVSPLIWNNVSNTSLKWCLSSKLYENKARSSTYKIMRKSMKISSCLSLGPSNLSSFVSLFFTISSSISMHRSKIVGKREHPCLTPMLLNKYLGNHNRHLACSYNRATTAPYFNGIMISIILFQSSIFGMVSKAFLKSTKQQYSVFPWNQLSPIITVSVAKWLIVECFSLKPAWLGVCDDVQPTS